MTTENSETNQPSRPPFQIEDYKTPWWSRLLGWYRARKALKAKLEQMEKDKSVPKYLCTVEIWTWCYEHENYINKGYHNAYWYNLYYNGHGKRWYEFTAEKNYLNKHEKRCAVYVKVIDPWSKGQWTNQQMLEWNDKRVAPKDRFVKDS